MLQLCNVLWLFVSYLNGAIFCLFFCKRNTPHFPLLKPSPWGVILEKGLAIFLMKRKGNIDDIVGIKFLLVLGILIHWNVLESKFRPHEKKLLVGNCEQMWKNIIDINDTMKVTRRAVLVVTMMKMLWSLQWLYLTSWLLV